MVIWLSNVTLFRTKININYTSEDLFSQLGITYLDMDLLLGYHVNENIPGCRESVIKEFGQCLASMPFTHRFVSLNVYRALHSNNPMQHPKFNNWNAPEWSSKI